MHIHCFTLILLHAFLWHILCQKWRNKDGQSTKMSTHYGLAKTANVLQITSLNNSPWWNNSFPYGVSLKFVLMWQIHAGVIKSKLCPGYWPFVRGIHQTLVVSLKRPVTRSFDVFFDRRLNKGLSKKSRRRKFDATSHSLSGHCNATVNHQWIALNRRHLITCIIDDPVFWRICTSSALNV